MTYLKNSACFFTKYAITSLTAFKHIHAPHEIILALLGKLCRMLTSLILHPTVNTIWRLIDVQVPDSSVRRSMTNYHIHIERRDKEVDVE